MGNEIKNIIVVGASSAGLLSSIALKTFFPNLQVTLLYSRKYSPIGVGESTTAWVPQFLHEYLKIPIAEFYKAMHPVWKLGIRFEWGQPEASHFNYTFDQEFWHETGKLSQTPGFYCMYDMNQASRFSVLMDQHCAPVWKEGPDKINLVSKGFGYHLDIEKFLSFLHKKALSLNVDIQEREVVGAILDDQGNLQALNLQDDQQMAADLFVDCSGFKSALLSGVMQEKFVSFQDRLFCDSAIVGSFQRQSPIFPFTTVTTMNAGWRWRIDLKDRISFGYVYSSEFCDEDEAVKEYLIKTPNTEDNLRKITFKSGRYQNFWSKNVVAIGNAAGFVEPLESTGQHMVAETLWRLITVLQDSQLRPMPKLVETTNQYIGQLWDEICDFLTLHFKFNHWLNTPFWQYCREKTDLGNAQALVDLYQESGACRMMSHLVPKTSIFEVGGYLTMLCGQRLPTQPMRPLTESEVQEWQQYRNMLQQELSHALTPQEAFQFLEQYVFD